MLDTDQQLHQKLADLDIHGYQTNLIGYRNLKKFNPQKRQSRLHHKTNLRHLS